MTTPFIRRCIVTGLSTLAFSMAAPGASAAIRAPWLDEPYTYVGDGESIQRVLQIFVHQFGLTVDIDTGVTATINGEIAERTPKEFLDRLASMHGFDWYLDSGTLYVSAIGKRQRKMIKAPAGVIGQLRSALDGAGVYQDRFGWGELVGQGQLLVYGPPAYVRRLSQMVDLIAAAPSGYEIALFPLKYANVEDRVITYRDKETKIPGVASIVRGIASGIPDLGSKELPPLPADVNTEANADLRSDGAAPTVGAGNEAAVSAGAWRASQGAAVIQSDVRMNALIVKAPPEMLSFYKRLIEQLDVDVPLVQIEVTILDIDSDYLDNVGVNWALSNSGSSHNIFDLNPMTATLNTILPRGLNLYAQINFLQRDGRGEVISKPSLLTMDNTAALFDSNETSYIRTRGERVVETKEVSAGLMFKVVPRVIRSADPDHPELRKILLQIDIEDGKRVNSADAELPVFKKSTISTQAIVGDSESLLIAGHQHQERQTSTTKVPILGSLPLIGALFRNEKETSGRRTRFFIITPRIVSTLQLDNQVALPVFESSKEMRAGSDTGKETAFTAPLSAPDKAPETPATNAADTSTDTSTDPAADAATDTATPQAPRNT
ncbi:MAG: Type secretion outerrane pore forming protein YscC [Herbaspirillum sp.]|nr:Type secretion outerrane pore forming protein YscC [Herbaspirillum sp.]